jgi:hypothetical protein
MSSSHADSDPGTVPEEAANPDFTRGVLGAGTNVLIVLLVPATYWMQQKESWDFMIWFLLLEAVTIVLYVLLPLLRADRVYSIAASVVRLADSSVKITRRTSKRSSAGRLPKLLTSLWIAALWNLGALGYLVHWTGGPIQSPYSALAFAFILNAQMLVGVSQVEMFPDLRGAGEFVLRAVWTFRSSLIAGLVFYGATLIAWRLWPVDKVPDVEVMQFATITVFSVVTTSVINLFTRAERSPQDTRPALPADGREQAV